MQLPLFLLDGPFLLEKGLHLQTEFHRFVMTVICDIGPLDPLAGGDSLRNLDLMGESDGEIPGGDGSTGRQEGSVDGRAAFSVQYTPRGAGPFLPWLRRHR